MDLMVGNMLKSIYHRLEVQMFYGQSGIGVVKTLNQEVGSTKTIAIQDAEWAAGLWNGTTGAEIEIFDTTLASKSISSDIRVQGYSLADKTITIERVDGGNFVTASLFRVEHGAVHALALDIYAAFFVKVAHI